MNQTSHSDDSAALDVDKVEEFSWKKRVVCIALKPATLSITEPTRDGCQCLLRCPHVQLICQIFPPSQHLDHRVFDTLLRRHHGCSYPKAVTGVGRLVTKRPPHSRDEKVLRQEPSIFQFEERTRSTPTKLTRDTLYVPGRRTPLDHTGSSLTSSSVFSLQWGYARCWRWHLPPTHSDRGCGRPPWEMWAPPFEWNRKMPCNTPPTALWYRTLLLRWTTMLWADARWQAWSALDMSPALTRRMPPSTGAALGSGESMEIYKYLTTAK